MRTVLLGLVSAVFLGGVCAAQVSLPEKRQAALQKIAAFGTDTDDAAFRNSVDSTTNPFSPEVIAAATDNAEGGTPADFDTLVQKTLRISGIFQLADGSQAVFINSRRVRIGESFRFKMGGKDVEARLVSVVQRRVTIEADGRVIVISAR